MSKSWQTVASCTVIFLLGVAVVNTALELFESWSVQEIESSLASNPACYQAADQVFQAALYSDPEFAGSAAVGYAEACNNHPVNRYLGDY